MSNTGTSYCPKCYVEFFCPGDRHPKWVKVDPGTVIPAGQPYRVERADAGFGSRATEYVDDRPHEVRLRDHPVFVDSSWKPPLDLPTEPTWGIPMAYGCPQQMSQWHETTFSFRSLAGSELVKEKVTDFIPLTPEQVSRLEACG